LLEGHDTLLYSMNMHPVLFEDDARIQLRPFTFTRPVAEIWLGMAPNRLRWEKILGRTCSIAAENHLQKKYPLEFADDNILINSAVLPYNGLAERLGNLGKREALAKDQKILAVRLSGYEAEQFVQRKIPPLKTFQFDGKPLIMRQAWELYRMNRDVFLLDYNLFTKNKVSASLPSQVTCIGQQIFIEEGAVLAPCIINSETGPVYISRHAEIMEGALVRGPLYLGEQSVIKMGTRIYGATTLGPGCKIGGEVNNCIVFGNTNKAHDGFIGNSVIGEWVNMGANTNCSNLKNNYAPIRVWSYAEEKFTETGLQFCGLMMGDYSKSGISSMFNTGTVAGISVNVFGAGFLPKYIPSFSWGEPGELKTFQPEKAIESARRMMERRNFFMTEIDEQILLDVFNLTLEYRKKAGIL